MSNNLYSNLHKLYPVQKTLRFELKPVGKTVENIEKNEILKTDEEKLGLAKLLKKEMDEFYKIKIDEILETLFLEGLERYYEELSDKEKSEENTTYLKQQIINKFNEKIKFIKNNKLDKDEIEDKGKESIIKILTSESLFTLMKDYYKSDVDKLNLINEFKGYSVYFSGFWKNRNFMFGGSKVEDAKKGSIPYRLIDENLPLFIQNINVYNNILIKGNEELKSKINSILTENNFFDNINKFNSALTQKSIEKYNLLITGYSKKDGTKVQGLNEIANLYNQEHHLRGAEKIPAFTILFKQILSEKSTESFVIDIIENDEEVFSIIDDFIDNIEFNTILFDEISNKEQVYILNKLNITQLSKDLLGNWNEITNKLYEWYFNNINNKNSSKKYEENRKKYFNKIKEYNIKFIETIANKDLLEHFKKTNQSLIDNINKYKNEYKNLPKVSIDNLKKDNKSIEAIKDLLDSIKALQDFLYQFNIVNPSLEKDIAFYDEFNKYYTNLKEIIPIYNKIRNYISKKAFLTDKIKLNFNNASLMTGWSRSKEYEKSGIMLKKYNEKRNEYDYFVGIINIDNRGDLKGNEDYSPFDVFINNEAKENFYEKMELNLFPGASKMLPKCFVSAKQYQETLDKTFLDNYKAGKHTKSNLDKDYLCDYINYMKQKLAENYSHFNFEFSNTENYNSIDEFYKEVDEQGYHVSFSKIEESKINELIENNNLYLFQIWSKDFSEYSKGLPNNQTIYLQQLFSKENLENTTIKLSGNSEVFFRKKSIPYEETHKANEELKNKNEKNNKKTSKFNYPLIKDKRYTENKFSFHFPIVINFKNEKYSPKDLNTLINTNIDSFNHIIGIDRGERNLVYVVIIDKNGQIQEQISLNEIINEHRGNTYETDYHNLLVEKERKRDVAKKAWTTIENIKELKEGYISQVVNKVKEFALKYNAIIILENLNPGFKNSRIKIDSQVYQRLEIGIIKKLNYIINKKDPTTYLKGIQLTNPITTLDKIGNQSGIVYYIPAWNTSKIDPTTGFINLMFGLKYENTEKTQELIRKIKDIRYNNIENYYEFDIDFKDFNPKYHNTKTFWTICTYGSRITNFRDETIENHYNSKVISNLTNEWKNLFEKYNISENYLQKSIEQTAKDFFEQFISLLKLTLQMRNSIIGGKTDYMISPVKNKNGKFFDSRECIENLPKDADANGAYNIARKGLILVNRIKQNPVKVDYKITNEEWLKFVQKQDV